MNQFQNVTVASFGKCDQGVNKEEALNCVEHMLMEGDIDSHEYESLKTVIRMMRKGRLDLGDGLCLVVIDESV
jgi:O-phosphoseryl-tRNA(Cys) synthetase